MYLRLMKSWRQTATWFNTMRKDKHYNGKRQRLIIIANKLLSESHTVHQCRNRTAQKVTRVCQRTRSKEKISAATGDWHKTSRLLQGLSVTLQTGNSSVLSTSLLEQSGKLSGPGQNDVFIECGK